MSANIHRISTKKALYKAEENGTLKKLVVEPIRIRPNFSYFSMQINRSSHSIGGEKLINYAIKFILQHVYNFRVIEDR